jgi:hypothetical protein
MICSVISRSLATKRDSGIARGAQIFVGGKGIVQVFLQREPLLVDLGEHDVQVSLCYSRVSAGDAELVLEKFKMFSLSLQSFPSYKAAYLSSLDGGFVRLHSQLGRLRQGEWVEHRLAFSDFVPTFRGRVLTDAPPLNPATVNPVGFLISDKQAGPFRLEIGWIKALH